MKHVFRWTIACLAAALAAVANAAEFDPALLKPNLLKLPDGRSVHFKCVGQGSPTVVFAQGGEGMMFNWGSVQPAITAMTRTCFYDRGGFGWSSPPVYPVTAKTVTDELRAVLQAAQIRDPVVLVGHSIGGFYATMYADRFPDQVAGMVLVDPGFAGQSSGLVGERADLEQASIRRGEADLLRCAELARRKVLNAANLREHGCYALPPSLSDAEANYALHAVTGPHWYEAEQSQSVSYFATDRPLSISHQQERDAAKNFGAMPLIVLSRGKWIAEPWQTAAEGLVARERWNAGHAGLAERSTAGRLRVVDDAGHFIQRDRPSVVVDAVRGVLDAVRDRLH